MTFKQIVAFLGLFALASLGCDTNGTIYVISNAEQPSLSRPGLSPVGYQRANDCLPQLLSTLNIGKIIMCPQNNDSAVCFETLATTQPTADALGLPIDTTCGADENTDDNCVQDLIHNFTSTNTNNVNNSILIVWDFHEVSTLISEDLDFDTPDAIDGVHYDLVTIIAQKQIQNVVSQNCSGIDGQASGTYRRRSLKSNRKKGKKKRPSLGHRRRWQL